MAEHPNEALVIYGYSQGAVVANMEKQKLAEQYPEGTEAPDIDFVLIGDPNLPNGGLASPVPRPLRPDPRRGRSTAPRRPTPSSTRSRSSAQYDGFSDFPLYPLNLVSTANAVLGVVYVHPYDLEPSLADPMRRTAAHPHQDRRHRLLLLRDRGSAAVRPAAHASGCPSR